MLIVPGMQTTSKANYIKHYVDIAKRLDCIAVVQNHRGSRCDLLTPRFYSGSNYEDLDMAVQHIRKLFPEHKIFAVGISMGKV
jgi:predicted alpha/beta-fold hydrolase